MEMVAYTVLSVFSWMKNTLTLLAVFRNVQASYINRLIDERISRQSLVHFSVYIVRKGPIGYSIWFQELRRILSHTFQYCITTLSVKSPPHPLPSPSQQCYSLQMRIYGKVRLFFHLLRSVHLKISNKVS